MGGFEEDCRDDVNPIAKTLDQLDLGSVKQANGVALPLTDGGPVNGGKVIVEVSPERHDETQDKGKNGTPIEANVTAGPKKKKSKSKAQRGLTKPTGFEEFYVDAPVTPAEYEEEKSTYDPSLAFSEYTAKRKLDEKRKDLFDQYMAYGGIDCGQKMFSGGLDQHTLEEKNAAEIATMTATHFVNPDREDTTKFVVDFDGCARGFLSSRLPCRFDVTFEQQIRSYTAIIRNFLNYLLHHDVCPEYNTQINAARTTCDRTDKELWSVSQASAYFPGPFNTACSITFGGSYKDSYIGNQEWAKDYTDIPPGMSPDAARKILKIGLAAQASEDVFQAFKAQTDEHNVTIIEALSTSLEITALIPADPDILTLYKSQEPTLQPLGKLLARTWHNPNRTQPDLTIEEEAAAASAPKAITEYEFWLEDDILAMCFVGMKFEATVRKMSFGMSFFDALEAVHVSFYEVLPNEMVIGWREVEENWLPRRPKEEIEGEIEGDRDGEEEMVQGEEGD